MFSSPVKAKEASNKFNFDIKRQNIQLICKLMYKEKWSKVHCGFRRDLKYLIF